FPGGHLVFALPGKSITLERCLSGGSQVQRPARSEQTSVLPSTTNRKSLKPGSYKIFKSEMKKAVPRGGNWGVQLLALP
ncbi:MAG: hypothetical protein MI861_03585, partial [Pirellulales bacterium]|nr:hypothetical protein [Pirellulales bacterium]